MFKSWQLDNDSCCYFCAVGYESINHLFGSCEKLKGLWEILTETHLLLTGKDFNYEFARKQFHLDFASIKLDRTYEKTLVFLNSVTNYNIWRHRNDIRHCFINFDLKELTRKIVCSIGARKNKNHYVLESYKVPFIHELYDAIVTAVNHYPFDNG